MPRIVALLLVIVATACGGDPSKRRQYPRWTVDAPPDAIAWRDCAGARAFVRKSGKAGVGIALELRSNRDCTVEIARAELVLADGTRARGEVLPIAPLRGRSLVHLWLPVPFDGDRAWNRGVRAATLELDLAIAGAAQPTIALPLVVRWDGPIESTALRRHSSRNAPGVVDVDLAFPGERGDPAAHEPPADPGEHQLGVGPGVAFMGGVPRRDGAGDGGTMFGVFTHLVWGERARTGHQGALGFPLDGYGTTLGWDLAQLVDGDPAIGPVWAEATAHRLFLGVGAGAVVYPTPSDVDVGAQLSLWAGPLAVRFRYVEDSGFELWGGYAVYLPAAFTWSR